MAFFKQSDNPLQDADTDARPRASSLFADINVRVLNRFLVVVTVVLGALAVYHVATIDTSISLPPMPPPEAGSLNQDMTEFKSEKEYLAPVARRDVFRIREFERGAEEKPPVQLAQDQIRSKLEELKGRVVVVGVSWQEPRLVMLYDKRKRETYFLRETDVIGDTDIKVTEIKRRKVKIGLQDEETDL